jgi:flagellar basal-body rod protein FlgB
MDINHLTNSGALPALEMTVRFAGQRHRLIAHNVANIDTPDFRPLDASPSAFQEMLGEAIDDRRANGSRGALQWKQTRQFQHNDRGELRVVGRTPADNILFQDRNNRDLERMMQDLAENTAVFRIASDLLRHEHQQLQAAIAERV